MKELVIEIPYGGLGDHLFHSHIPRIAKESGVYDKVYISNLSLFRHNDNKTLVWELNPFIDGFVDIKGVSCNLESVVNKLSKINNSKSNLLDEIMLIYGLDNNVRWNEPEIYYVPVFKEEYNKVIYDPNFLSWVGTVEKYDLMRYLRKNKLEFEFVMQARSEKALYEYSNTNKLIETKSLFDYCDLVFSSSKFYCLTSGSATIAAALKKPSTVFYGKYQGDAFRHSKLHEYIEVRKSLVDRIVRKMG